jgi:transposase-like protein
MCVRFGVPVEAVLTEFRRRLGEQIDSRQGLSIAEASRLCDVSRKTISNWLREARQAGSGGGSLVFSRIEFLGQLCDFCRDRPRSIAEIQARARQAGWRYGYEAREVRRTTAELAAAGALVRDPQGRFRTAPGSTAAGYTRVPRPDPLEGYRQRSALLQLADGKESPLTPAQRFRTTRHYQVAEIEEVVQRVRSDLANTVTRHLRDWQAPEESEGVGAPRTIGILIAAAPTVPPELNSMLSAQERMTLLNSACEATSPFPRERRVNRVFYVRFTTLEVGLRYIREQLLAVVEKHFSAAVDPRGEEWLGVAVAAAPLTAASPEDPS